MQKLETSIPFEKLGPPGIQGELVIVDVFKGETRKDESRMTDLRDRPFTVYGRLSKTSENPERLDVGFDEEDGGSYLLMPERVLHSRVQAPQGPFEIYKNRKGELSFVRFDCRGTSIQEARLKFSDAVMPFIDYLSYEANCPLFVPQTRVEDEQNHLLAINYLSPHRPVLLNPHAKELFIEIAPIYAMYREAKNASSFFYRFLCYYKILEGLLGPLRSDVYRRAKENGFTLSSPRDVIKAHSELKQAQSSYVGKPVKVFFDEYLTPRFRNAVAHFVTGTGSVLNISSLHYIAKYSEVALIMEQCCRTLIQTHEGLLLELRSRSSL